MRDRAQFGAEQGQDDVDLVHAQRRLAALQFADEPQADAGAVGQLRLRQPILLPFAADIRFNLKRAVEPSRMKL